MDFKTITVKNGGLELEVCNFGAAIKRLLVPDAYGRMGDIVLGHDKPEEYVGAAGYLGVVAGRVCNRIGGAKAKIDGKLYRFDCNESARKNTLHGGAKSLSEMFWDMCECSGDYWKGVRLHLLSPDMQNGFPGNLDISITYKLTEDCSLEIDYVANTDKPTLCALTNHSYFNLSAGKSPDILDHEIRIFADYFTPVSSNMVTTGEVLSVKNTALDLRKFTRIGDGIASGDPHIAVVGGGYDHNFVLQNGDSNMVRAALVYERKSGRIMEVFTTESGVQFYSGTFLSIPTGKKGAVYGKYAGLALETQNWPDAANKSHFPPADLYPDETYGSTTIYKFATYSHS